MSDARDSAPAALDIKALLRVALEQGPKDDVQERVLTRMAATTTLMEFARLVFVAPFHWLAEDAEEADDDVADE